MHNGQINNILEWSKLMKLPRRAKHIITVGGGKGGVGKSIFSIALATVLAEMGNKVVIADFDLGSANLHTYMGINSGKSLADFFHKKVTSLDELLVETDVHNLKLISGSEFMPGIANPAYWVKMKLIRHVKALETDYVIIDLGAGVHYNILDLFGIADNGMIITTQEPGAVINAYTFIKGALFRKIQVVFQHHPQIGPIVKGLMDKSEDEGIFTLDWIKEQIKEVDAEMEPIINEISNYFMPNLVVNNVIDNSFDFLVDNLKELCNINLGVSLNQIGVIKHADNITPHLIEIPAFLKSPSGSMFNKSVHDIAQQLIVTLPDIIQNEEELAIRRDYDDETIRKLFSLIDNADKSIFKDSCKKIWKLRLFFKPHVVVRHLIGKGLENKVFYQ